MTFRAAFQIGFILGLNLFLSLEVGFAIIHSTAPVVVRLICAVLYVVPASVLAKGIEVVKE